MFSKEFSMDNLAGSKQESEFTDRSQLLVCMVARSPSDARGRHQSYTLARIVITVGDDILKSECGQNRLLGC